MDKQTLIERARGLIAQYKANEAVLAQLSYLNLIAVVGPSGAGKSTVSRRAGLPFVIGDTTRPPRATEVHGVDYNFRTDYAALLQEIEDGEFVQLVLQRETEIYGTKASSYPSSGSCTMSILAGELPKFLGLGFGSVLPVYIVPPDYSEWMKRLSSHRDKDLEARLMEAKDSLRAALADPSYVFILNDQMDQAIAAMRAVAKGSVDQSESARARSVAVSLYERLERVIR